MCVYVCVYVRRLSGRLLESLQPLNEILIGCLRSRLSVYCHVINTHLLHVLTRDHCLLDCFTIIRVFTFQLCYFLFAYNTVCTLYLKKCANFDKLYLEGA